MCSWLQCSVTAVRIEAPHVAAVEFNQLMPVKGREGGKTDCENRQGHILHHLLSHPVIRVNFGMVPTSSNESAPSDWVR